MKQELIKNLPNFTPFEIDNSFSRRQKLININGIDIHFPYEIYDNQKKYMEKVIQLLNNRISINRTNIAALESPTGTGKTLCLLCSTLAWMNEMRRQKKFGGKIIYTSRTHSQISQVIHELRKTCYRPRTAVLSSRDHSCVNSEIRKNISGNILNIKCRKNCVKCAYYNGVLSDKREKNNMLDIEELFKNGKAQTFCPFYQQIEIAKSYSDIVFMPYNYIFDEDINNIMEINIANDIIIIDEAHNIRKVCEDSKSIEIKSNDFDDIINDLESFLKLDEEDELVINYFKPQAKNKKKKSIISELNKEDISIEKNAIINIQNKFNEYQMKLNNNKGQKLTYFEFFDIFMTKEEKTNKIKKKKFKHKDDELSCDSILSVNISENINVTNIDDHISFLENLNKNFQEIFEKGTKLSILLKIFNIIKQLVENIILQKHYMFYMQEEEQEKLDKETNETIIEKIKKFFIFCFSPQLGFSDILKNDPFSIIFTSGTLIPFKLYENEFKIKFDITLENEHIIPNEQMNFNIITNYEEGIFRFDYNNRNNIEMIKALGNAIINYCIEVQNGGILVFFPSFYYLNECNKIWSNFGINKNIRKYKKLYIDSSTDKHLITQIKDESSKNYIFFSVFRGIASEGIDFSDDNARAVICIGIPFADISENRVKLKIEYLNNLKKEDNNLISGQEWYIADAMTAVNQSLGRVIRHKFDYGTMICFDERYKKYEKYFSFWIRDYYEKYKNDEQININDFLNEQREKFKDIIPEKIRSFLQKDTNKQSGFNTTIKFDDNLFLGNNKKSKEISNEDEEMEDEEEDINIDINDNISQSKKLSNNDKFVFPKEKEQKINIINVGEIGYKTNHNTILEDISKSCKQKIPEVKNDDDLCETFNVTKKINNDNHFEKEEQQGKELLESLKVFLISNKNEFNSILNKYK